MAITKKRADELKPGDVIVFDDARYALQYVSTASPGENMSERHQLYCLAGLGRRVEAQPGLDRIARWMAPDAPVYAEVPAVSLTPAQQHAEELAVGLRKAIHMLERSDYPDGAETDSLRALLDKIKPPEPPTLEEALADALETMLDSADGKCAVHAEHKRHFRALLSRFRPVVAPTLPEALAALADLKANALIGADAHEASARASDILDRARRANLIK